ncbi:hypothetical protein RV11_GL003260 [Enterococcus phoeniculicola]|jgi:hypothetical protein|uniref:Uncharacterized protein n=1 Tax=Enterococcus phoeniculicola ATCC BAA-412 TaxID=1158610 RepID=R3X3Z6_9ENTE|nr:hypothetical protein [Enterococcus phoeniculicola]EOL48765.1 hypothetical protein UC3_00316 [Enterococcus phoeniculicola ATCC BAA-412]EOT72611.1 hypothetical protein I589_02880 [Enterococcus phoeniculicola ATCC BAA-412]OJG71885.1 hypothetical protein RV11_GL003260 [Enterococcus phoeniculicola]
MKQKKKEQLVSEVVDKIVKRKGTKVKAKTKTMKIKRKFDTKTQAKEYEAFLREKYTRPLLEELNRLLEEK